MTNPPRMRSEPSIRRIRGKRSPQLHQTAGRAERESWNRSAQPPWPPPILFSAKPTRPVLLYRNYHPVGKWSARSIAGQKNDAKTREIPSLLFYFPSSLL